VEGNPNIRQAPDALVAFGRPKGYRGSYKQWEEDNIAPQVVFEVMSPGNRAGKMRQKFEFYQRYGVEEYYLYDPDRGTLRGWRRVGDKLEEIASMQGWVSPRLQVRFDLVDGELEMRGRDGEKFASYVEVVAQRQQERREKEQAQREKEQAQREKEQAQREREQERERAERLAAQLRALGIEPQE
jgi:hypothetical protein